MDGPVDKGRQHQLVGITVACVSLGTIIIIARVCTRLFIVRSLGKDDWAMVLGWAATVGYMCQILLLARWGIGLPATENSMEDMVRMMKVTLAIQATYYFAVAFIKISIVLFYLRLVEAQTVVRRLCHGTIALLAVFLGICLTGTLAQCVPMEKQWDFIGAVPGKCINTTAFFYSTSAFNIITDIWIICLPIRVLSKIHRPQREKIILFVVFGMGVLACVASIVRLYSIRVFTLSQDPFYDGGPVNIWSMVEINVAIVCASVPGTIPLASADLSTPHETFPTTGSPTDLFAQH
ncbi:uncharacterized protein BP5553_02389 [Venustampulla echinocandica]|uniref:Rhodopsin domain-containing protein n=1 Tax=Venustampulla echinocandica TaxID=2656787 RepID=A0A370U3Q2_9HELO|nr:uncharacterized protein BP5553_02389 [Venustampulla echinocandica]RDL42410.1 hypothetical protein BP5553_02389 [Venustampulla echinocandica]